ncbi:TetR/AcrR family transcriptional regulator [Amycolatopsis sp. NPDC088138]|uniref:TetR/AcrR family transcriptional regulator n=1 Tax=Amycolatopsis sp. NPDC088138 TaxID=3363938 RepID=UPI003815BD97
MDRVAQAAGVGKGTVFHRFGNREGLMRAVVEERVRALSSALESEPPPLGPGAPPAERLAAFFDAVVELATKNVTVMAAFEQASTDPPEQPDLPVLARARRGPAQVGGAVIGRGPHRAPAVGVAAR